MFARACLRQFNVAFTSASRAAITSRATTAAIALPAFHRQWTAPFSSSSVARWPEEESYEREERTERRPRQKSPPSDTLFLGNLPFSVSDEELKIAFSQIAPVKDVRAAITRDGMHKGYAHVEFHSVADAKRVYESDQEDPIFIVGRDIVVDYSAPRSPGGGDRGGGRGDGDSRGARRVDRGGKPNRTLYFWGFNGTTEDEVRTALKEYDGDIVTVRFLLDRETGKPFGNGFIDFQDVETASKVKEAMSGVESAHNGETMNLSFSRMSGSPSTNMRRPNLERVRGEATHRDRQDRGRQDREWQGGRQRRSEPRESEER
ncbi:RNA-binding domain-containing protein [Coniophora puteana RWD-64-598 SS2]|uniref:RNA-binding domain-containing protein n=1 Tax=Coniophora puteana (strain RWD-64-598) TaxID=741705 RepID=A0A5M3M7R1_CONPW|nr:RNA-binding domain-containing protein [Coniophora puteana RWD-64-598 SS2]EIW74810.1 RNA-binding domain-containing protein [Coniophora puteana RWD-64-598 SS2]